MARKDDLQNLAVRVSEKEARTIGEQRWQREHQARLIIWGVSVLALAALAFYLGIFEIWEGWFPFGLFVVGGIGLLVYIGVGNNRAGRTFLEKAKRDNQSKGLR